MKEIFEKLTSYNLFNYLLPGVIFSIIASEITEYDFIQENIIIGLFLYYFVGMTISRLGSLLIEPLMKIIGILKFSDYKDFVNASKKDSKIEIISEANNTYRTFISLFLNLIILKCYNLVENKFYWFEKIQTYLILIVLLIVFILSYRKQTNYLVKRIKSNL